MTYETYPQESSTFNFLFYPFSFSIHILKKKENVIFQNNVTVCDKMPNIFCHSMFFFFFCSSCNGTPNVIWILNSINLLEKICGLCPLILFYGMFRWLGKGNRNKSITLNVVHQVVCYVHFIFILQMNRLSWRQCMGNVVDNGRKMVSIKNKNHIYAHLKKVFN